MVAQGHTTSGKTLGYVDADVAKIAYIAGFVDRKHLPEKRREMRDSRRGR
jgi:hypothetical protein